MMAYKAAIFKDESSWNTILLEIDPSKHKKLGRKVKNFNDSIWNENCKHVVYVGNYYKFTQNPCLLKELLETKGELVEASPYDTIWGIGLSAQDPRAYNKAMWRGTNWLGEILTKLRIDLCI